MVIFTGVTNLLWENKVASILVLTLPKKHLLDFFFSNFF